MPPGSGRAWSTPIAQPSPLLCHNLPEARGSLCPPVAPWPSPQATWDSFQPGACPVRAQHQSPAWPGPPLRLNGQCPASFRTGRGGLFPGSHPPPLTRPGRRQAARIPSIFTSQGTSFTGNSLCGTHPSSLQPCQVSSLDHRRHLTVGETEAEVITRRVSELKATFRASGPMTAIPNHHWLPGKEAAARQSGPEPHWTVSPVLLGAPTVGRASPEMREWSPGKGGCPAFNEPLGVKFVLAPAPTSRMNSGKSLNIQSTLSSPHVPTCTHTHTHTRMHTRPHPPPALPSALRMCASERAGGWAGAGSPEPAQGPPALGPASAAGFCAGSCLCGMIRRPLRTNPLSLPAGGLPPPLLRSGQEGTPRWARGFAT